MSKVSTYLQSHVVGEVSTRTDVRQAFSTDGGVLRIEPEMVIYPRATNDIRKVARFSWQLAEKGHPLAITARGGGTDAVGAALGKGVVLALAPHMHTIFEYDAKQKLVRLQPGTSIDSLTQALGLHGATVHVLQGSHGIGTVGGAIANATGGMYAGVSTLLDTVDQLEVVLANGDVLQTERISKRELSKRKGKEGFEGDIYRGIDGIIEEYADVISTIPSGDYTGYSSIADVRRKDGSFDLAPLFIGSQGTLGIITEMILKVEARSEHRSAVALVFKSREVARDAIDALQALNPQLLEYIDGAFYDQALKAGKSYAFYTADSKAAAVVIVGFENASERLVKKSLKRLEKAFGNHEGVHLMHFDSKHRAELASALDVVRYISAPDQTDVVAPALYTGVGIPLSRLEEFCQGLEALATKERIDLPMAGHVTTGIYGVYPLLSLKKVGDKQKILKLVDALATLVGSVDGTLIAEGGEGILKSRAVRARLDPKLVEMYDAIRKVFDPYDTLNPGVKQDVDLKTLAGYLRNEPSVGDFSRFGL
ncbi:MAG: FAD-binding oxidoreductase [Candidatus Saccharimonas sp.]